MKALFRILVLSICLFTITNTAAMAAPAGDDVKVTSEKMTYSADGQTVVFTGNVIVKHPEADMWANKVTVYLQSDKNAEKSDATGDVNPGKIEKIVSEGNVRIKMEQNRRGTCDVATYTLKDELLVMTGSPKLSEGKNTIAGNVIKFWVKENRSEVLGSSNQPVEAIFSAPGKAKE
ncbi:lipopolysaccharide transport periplasmic protein LptA [Halodesulfovibrio sp. MK-HDV]|jgi:lipopolysaccharide export system protein LptA|uniref:lipopolysaccharide transport periplasmic protein LptA n=1 Tax=Halodesulfovibrio sp. MK-HDV TaxID=2599925 RepID=UPI00136BC3F7|nr:lipopolysaccharide transport periplasmic protein LptA [Halodesulfovibrio sp. MK-HDV]KAF1077813.1 Lipopolysaccharide export system protein LptA [Halodesulfovibrio sp. MK-HDV]